MYPLFVGISLIMLLASIFCLYVAAFADVMKGWEQLTCMLIGAVGILFFLMCTMYLFFNLVSPSVGVSVNAKGVRDYTTAGKGAGFIPRESIVSLKLFGKDNKEFLGITILPDYIEALGLNNAAKREIQNNINSGTPAVVIRQADINVPIYKLMKLMVNKFENEQAINPPVKDVSASQAMPNTNSMVDESTTVLQPLEGLMLTMDPQDNEEKEIAEVITLDSDEEPIPMSINNDTPDDDLTVLTVDELPARPKTIDEMLAALVPNRKTEFSPLTVNEENEGNDNK